MTDPAAYRRLARQDGTFAMVAIDQRDTLRRLLRRAGRPDSDAALREFKASVIGSLAGLASAVLTDPEFGLPAAREAGLPGSATGLIVCADALVTDSAGRLVDSAVDEAVLGDAALLADADALKFLVMWPAADDTERIARTAAAITYFVGRCRDLGVLSVVETIMLETGGRLAGAAFDERLTAAASACGQTGPDLYKTQVPCRGQGDSALITEVSERISASLRCPWVVLSAGVPADAFPAAVRAACAGGASGFLCGQAVWGPSLKTADPMADLRTAAAARLEALGGVAAETARPWNAVVPA